MQLSNKIRNSSSDITARKYIIFSTPHRYWGVQSAKGIFISDLIRATDASRAGDIESVGNSLKEVNDYRK